MTDDNPKLLTREEAEKLLLADRQRQLTAARTAKPQVALLPNAMFPYWVFFVDEDIEARPVIAWHPNGQAMVVDTERGMLVQALAIGDIERIELLPSPLEG